MLQNRVDPIGNIIFTAARGHWMGNRGILHDEHQHVTKTFRLKAWLTCQLVFRGRKRTVMSPHRYTELFFLDEATAFAAGHRPCFECRRKNYERFKMLFVEANPQFGLSRDVSIRVIDDILHRERIDRQGKKVTYVDFGSALPQGTFVLAEGQPFLVAGGLLHAWTPFGYQRSSPFFSGLNFTVLTPASVVRTFRAGYRPQIDIQDTLLPVTNRQR